MPTSIWLAGHEIELWQAFFLAAAALQGLAAGWLSGILLGIAGRPLPSQAQSHEFESRRRLRLRAGSSFYRWFEPFVDDVSCRIGGTTMGAGSGRGRWLWGLSRIQKSLKRGGSPWPWTAAEFVALALLKSAALGGCALWAASRIMPWSSALVVALILAGLFYYVQRRSLHRDAEDRLAWIKQRLPYAVDLMALMMEAGGTFRESLGTAVAENRNHPLGSEFGKVLDDNTAGKPLHEALTELQDRLRDDDVAEIVSATNSAEWLGAPMSSTYLRLAEQMRLRRSQRAEREVGKAQTMITFPGFVIMLACMLTMMTPFVLSALRQSILR